MEGNSEGKGRTILYVDDDAHFLQLICNELQDEHGFTVLTATNPDDAIRLARNKRIDLSAVVLDVMMDPGGLLSAQEVHGGYRTGIALARMIRKVRPAIPILAVTASLDGQVVEWFEKQHKMSYLQKTSDAAQISAAVSALWQKGGRRPRRPRVFIVHGHDDKAKLELKNFLQNTLRLGEPVILHEQPSLGRVIIEKFEDEARSIDIVFVLLTPDDSFAADQSEPEKRRARQNVIFELGYFYAKLQRLSGRVLLLHKGEVDVPSDISGLIYIDISKGVKAAGEEIRRELAEWL